jgi:hypothetical protein
MNIKDIKFHPKYWQLHKEIYFNELDSLEFEIRDIISNHPTSGTAKRFNCSVDRLIADKIKESNNQSE